MAKSTIFKILGFVFLIISAFLFIMGLNLNGPRNYFGGLELRPGYIFAAFPLFFLTLVFLGIGFLPEVTKVASQINSEVIDHAGEEIKTSTTKTARVIAPAIKTGVDEIKKDKEQSLKEAKDLYENNLITKEEYNMMRKKILDID